jgi:hypothetical protein
VDAASRPASKAAKSLRGNDFLDPSRAGAPGRAGDPIPWLAGRPKTSMARSDARVRCIKPGVERVDEA